MKIILRFLLKYGFYSYLLWAVFFTGKEFYSPTYTDCGKVLSKSADEIIIKHGSRTDLFLNVRFKDSGFLSVKCNPTTYFYHQVGDYVCFDLDNYLSKFEHFTMIVGSAVMFITALISVIFFLIYVLDK